LEDLPVTYIKYELLNNVFERALAYMHKVRNFGLQRIIPIMSGYSNTLMSVFLLQMPRIWTEYLNFLMLQRKITRTRQAFDNALKSLPITQHERIWPLYVKFAHGCGVPETAIRVYRRVVKVRPRLDFASLPLMPQRSDLL
jgi:pre-mRNA-splicing factor SYF1